MSRRPQGRIRGTALVLALAALPCACDRREGASDAADSRAVDEAPAEVQVALARREEWPETLVVTGNLVPMERTTLGAMVGGRIVALDVDTGDAVTHDQPLARVDPAEYELAVATAEAQLRQVRASLGLPLEGDDDALDPEDTPQVREALAVAAEAEARLARLGALRTQEITSAAEQDEAEAAAGVATARVERARQEVANLRARLHERRAALLEAQRRLAETWIRAPWEGVVQRRRAGRGDVVAPGDPVVELVRMDPLRLQLEVPERAVPRLARGLPLRFTLEGDAREHAAVLERLSPELSRASRSLLVEAEVENPHEAGAFRLRAGTFARAVIVLGSGGEALAVPARALRSFAGVDRVLIVLDGALHEVQVTVGRREVQRVEILEGLREGQAVVLDPGSLHAGRRARVLD